MNTAFIIIAHLNFIVLAESSATPKSANPSSSYTSTMESRNIDLTTKIESQTAKNRNLKDLLCSLNAALHHIKELPEATEKLEDLGDYLINNANIKASDAKVDQATANNKPLVHNDGRVIINYGSYYEVNNKNDDMKDEIISGLGDLVKLILTCKSVDSTTDGVNLDKNEV